MPCPVRSCVRKPCSRVNGAEGGGANGGGLIPPGPAFACPFARERGQKGGKGGVPFPWGTEGGVTLPLCPFLAEEGEGRKGGAKRREGSRVWGEERRCTRYALLTHI